MRALKEGQAASKELTEDSGPGGPEGVPKGGQAALNECLSKVRQP